MKKKHFFLVNLIILMLSLAACQSNAQQETELTKKAPIQELPNTKNGLVFETEKEKYTTSSEEIVLNIHNEGENEFTTGTHFLLEKKVDGTWYEFPDDLEAVDADALIVFAGETGSIDISVSDLTYDLTSGEYRAKHGNAAAPFEVIE